MEHIVDAYEVARVVDSEMAAVEEEIRLQTHPSKKELSLLIRDWAALMRKQRQLKRKG